MTGSNNINADAAEHVLTISAAIDSISAKQERLFLAKLTLVLASMIGDRQRLLDAISLAKCDLE